MRLFLNVEKNNLLKVVFFSFLILPVQQGETSLTESSTGFIPVETLQEQLNQKWDEIQLMEEPLFKQRKEKPVLLKALLDSFQ